MVNERKTEDIVREHFKAYADDVVIEEQRSDSSSIQKLLAAASKQGKGQGQPDFIISVPSRPDFLIVVECKADPQKHESPDRSRYADFAVDGALLYASHLANGRDVLAIGVSGTGARNLKVTHYLHLQGEFRPRPMFGGRLLPVADYVSAWLNDPGKVQQDYDSLLSFTQDLNKRLHGDKIAESNRALLISAALIALERDSFRKAYTSETNPANLAKMLTDTVTAQLREANISGDRLSVLDQKFGFIETETVLTSKPGELLDIVWQIDKEVNSFVHNHEYQDIIGQLYVEFLRYANSDKGLGIVLTPPHITDFFAELAQVNKESVVYDNCAGTGGFLISATHLFGDEMLPSVSDRPAESQSNQIALVPADWGWFRIDELFAVSGTKTTPLRDLETYGRGVYPYVRTQSTNNGVAGYFDFKTEDGGVLTVDSAVVGYCAYQKFSFSASDHVEKLTPKFPMNDYVAMFLVTILNMEQYRYNYGRKCSQSRLKEAEIKLPATSKGAPDFAYIERYIKTLPYSANLQP